MCILHFTTQHPTPNCTRSYSALKITEISKIYPSMILKRGCAMKANCKNTNCCNHCRMLAQNRDLEYLFPLLWIITLTISSFTCSEFTQTPVLKLRTDFWWQRTHIPSPQLSAFSGSYAVTDLLSGRWGHWKRDLSLLSTITGYHSKSASVKRFPFVKLLAHFQTHSSERCLTLTTSMKCSVACRWTCLFIY